MRGVKRKEAVFTPRRRFVCERRFVGFLCVHFGAGVATLRFSVSPFERKKPTDKAGEFFRSWSRDGRGCLTSRSLTKGLAPKKLWKPNKCREICLFDKLVLSVKRQVEQENRSPNNEAARLFLQQEQEKNLSHLQVQIYQQ